MFYGRRVGYINNMNGCRYLFLVLLDQYLLPV